MSYAVVYFIQEGIFSEVPVRWLNAAQTECLWPPNNPKNITNLIKKKAVPESNWLSYDVKVEGIYDSIDEVITMAGKADTSSKDEEKGRGKRKKIARRHSSSDYTGSIDSMSPSPKIPEEQNLWQEYVPGNEENSVELQEIESTQDVIGVKMESISDNEEVEIWERVCDSKVLAGSKDQINNFFTNSNNKNLENMEKKIDKLLVMVSQMSLEILVLKEKITHMEKRQSTDKNWTFFKENLPCNSLEEVKKIDDYLESEENQKEFTEYLRSIGGSHPKDQVHRIMKTLFTNQFGMSCSWYGFRNNLKASDFRCIQIAQDFASQYLIQKAEFEKIAGEWLRLSTLRFKREK